MPALEPMKRKSAFKSGVSCRSVQPPRWQGRPARIGASGSIACTLSSAVLFLPITEPADSRMNIADLRMSYERDELDESASAVDPMAQFGHWLEQALHAELTEPNAMTLATVGPTDGRPRGSC